MRSRSRKKRKRKSLERRIVTKGSKVWLTGIIEWKSWEKKKKQKQNSVKESGKIETLKNLIKKKTEEDQL